MRRYATVFAAVIHAGCTSHDDRVQIAAPSTTVQQPALATTDVPPIGRGIPHATQIALVAVTESGDAALTADVGGGLRLWPTLDGARPPVLLHFGGDPDELAIVHAGGLPGSAIARDLVAMIRDRAGGVTIVRVGLDGTVRHTQQLAATSYVQLAAVDDGFVVRTQDHAVEWYALDGTLRGRIVADAGQQLLALAARHHQAAALVQTGDATAVRWLELADTLRWEPAIALPMGARPETFAIAPHARRVAFADASSSVRMFDASLSAGLLDTGNSGLQTAVGFFDDDSLALATSALHWWHRPAPDRAVDNAWSPSDVPLAMAPGSAPATAFADGLVVSATNGQLVLATPQAVHYLGWAVPAVGSFQAAPGHVALRTGTTYTWLDDDLTPIGSLDVRNTNGSYSYGQPIGSHYLVGLTSQGNFNGVAVIDATRPDRFMELASAKDVEALVVNGNMVGLRGQNKLRRFRVDLDAMTATELLPAIELHDYSIADVEIFDPDRAHGLAAFTASWERPSSEQQTFTRFRVVDGKVVAERDRHFDGSFVRLDPDGAVSFLDGNASRVRVVRDGQTVKEVRFNVRGSIAAAADYSRIVMRDSADAVALLDDQGVELWRTHVWQPSDIAFSPAESRVFVSSDGGIVALDAKTGSIVHRSCGFQFGLHDKPATVAPSSQGSVCEDSLLE